MLRSPLSQTVAVLDIWQHCHWHVQLLCFASSSQKLTFVATAHTLTTCLFHCTLVTLCCYVDSLLNVIKFRFTLNFLLLATLVVMDKFLSGYKREDRDNKDK